MIANMERLAHIYLTKTTYALLFGVVFSLFAWQFRCCHGRPPPWTSS
ncbi:hypothetical protein [Micrococcus luteus]|nr:hypothetical protein [Micrococcus luteus]